MQNISVSKDLENFGSNIRQNMVKPTIIRCKPIGKLTRKWKNNFPFRKSISRYGMSISFHFQVSCRNVLSSFYLYSKFTKNDRFPSKIIQKLRSLPPMGIPNPLCWGLWTPPRRCILVDTIHQPRLAAKEHRLQLGRVLHVQLNDAIAHDHIRHGEEKGDEANSTDEDLDGSSK